MILFMLLAFPIIIAYSLLMKNFYPEAQYKAVPLLAGFFLAVVYSFFQLFFFPAYYLIQYSFLSNFVYNFFYDVFIPLALCTLFLFVLAKKYNNKAYELYYLALGFFAVYVPARTFNITITFGSYELFFKPLLLVAMVYISKNIIIVAYRYNATVKERFSSKQHVAIKSGIAFAFVLCYMLPSVIETLYMLSVSYIILIPLILLYVVGFSYGSIIANKKLFITS